MPVLKPLGPMRQVSGVMGAAHLWNRIMLRLHEKTFPKSFPGQWTLEVKVGKMTDQVRFQVDVAQPRINRRGFSFRE